MITSREYGSSFEIHWNCLGDREIHWNSLEDTANVRGVPMPYV
jgi:hypothetical protein